MIAVIAVPTFTFIVILIVAVLAGALFTFALSYMVGQELIKKTDQHIGECEKIISRQSDLIATQQENFKKLQLLIIDLKTRIPKQ